MKRGEQQRGQEKTRRQLGAAVSKIVTDKQKYDGGNAEHVKHVTGKDPVKGDDKKDG